MGRLAIAVLVGLAPLLNGQTAPLRFPNPAKDPQACGLRSKGFVCDPDSVLSDTERAQLSATLLKRVYQGTQNKHKGSKCMSKGITVVVAFVNKIPSRGPAATDAEMESWTRAVQRNWNLEPECHKDVVIGFSKTDRRFRVVTDTDFTGITPAEVNSLFQQAIPLVKSEQYYKAMEGIALAFADDYNSARGLQDPLARGGGGSGSRGSSGSGSRNGGRPDMKMPDFKMPKLSMGVIIGVSVLLLCVCCCCCCLCYCCKQLRQSFCPCLNKEDGGARGGMGKMGNFSLPSGMASKIPSSLFGGRMGSGQMGRYGGAGGMGMAAGAGAGYMAGGGGGGDGGFSSGATDPPPPQYESGGGGWGEDEKADGAGGGGMYPAVASSGGAFDAPASPPKAANKDGLSSGGGGW